MEVDASAAQHGAPGAAARQTEPRAPEPLEVQMAEMRAHLAVMEEALARIRPDETPRARQIAAAEAAAAEAVAGAAATTVARSQ